MDGFPSGQRGQTVNLLAMLSVVRIHLHPLAGMTRLSYIFIQDAGMAELADAQDLKSCGTYLPYRFDSGCRHEKIQHCKSWIFFRLTGNFRFLSNKNAPRGSHCGGKENAAFAARPRRRILRSRILFYSREWGKCDD